jgi:hypothetical protein
MLESNTNVTVTLPRKSQMILETLAGDTPDEKIAHLLLDEIERNLEACEKERLALEVKYGVEYPEFQRQLEAGTLGDEFGYTLETDAVRWADLIAEKQYWLQQLRLAREWVR